jgi:hypothetical protein
MAEHSNGIRERAQAVRGLGRLAGLAGAADSQRLARLASEACPDGRIRLSGALQCMFPDLSREDALTALRQMRKRLRGAAAAAGLDLLLEVDAAQLT